MSKNITIQEGGTAKSMTVNKLKTTLVAGGTCLWVPENEVQVGTKYITQNGTYEASSDNLYGFKTVTVNIAGGAGSATPSGTPTSTGGSTPGGIGSAVVGTDPTDGNEYAVGVDENGDLVKTKIPSSIEVVRNPNKTEYADGETIDYSGIIVSLKGGDGEPFANADYPNGHVPFSELTFPVETAEMSGDGVDEYTDGSGLNVVKASYVQKPEEFTTNQYVYILDKVLGTYNGYPYTIGQNNTVDATDVYLTVYNNKGYAYRIMGQAGGVNGFKLLEDGKWILSIGTSTTTKLGEWVVVEDGNASTLFANVPISTVDPTSKDVQNLQAKKQNIPVKWNSPYDGRVFEATFGITLTAAQETSGDEGGGGGHSF